MIPVVIESPYAGEVDLNTMYTRFCMRDSLLRGEAPFASHLLYTQPHILDDDDPEERAEGILAGFSWRNHAKMTVVYEDLGVTKGMELGMSHSRAIGIPVVFRRLSLDLLGEFEDAYYG